MLHACSALQTKAEIRLDEACLLGKLQLAVPELVLLVSDYGHYCVDQRPGNAIFMMHMPRYYY